MANSYVCKQSANRQDAAVQSLREQLRAYRTRAGLSQDDLAAAAGISGGMIAHVERGKRSIGVEILVKLADVMGLTDEERSELLAARDATSAAMSTKRPPTSAELTPAEAEELRTVVAELSAALREQREVVAELREVRDELLRSRAGSRRAAPAKPPVPH